MTPTEFLLARIAEDERMARTALTSTTDVDGGISWWWARFGDNSLTWEASPVPPARVLRECEAKRRIATRIGSGHPDAAPELNKIIALLAAVYSDHPDYDPAWAV